MKSASEIETERTALQALGFPCRTDSQPFGLGYLNCGPLGSHETPILSGDFNGFRWS